MRPSLRVLAPTALLLVLAGTAAAGPGDLHFELVKSEPAAEADLTAAPDTIRLWFSQEPELEGARIRLVSPTGDLVEMSDAAAHPDDALSLVAAVLGEVPAGDLTVHWRAMAKDGHVVTGEIPFALASPEGQAER